MGACLCLCLCLGPASGSGGREQQIPAKPQPPVWEAAGERTALTGEIPAPLPDAESRMQQGPSLVLPLECGAGAGKADGWTWSSCLILTLFIPQCDGDNCVS